MDGQQGEGQVREEEVVAVSGALAKSKEVDGVSRVYIRPSISPAPEVHRPLPVHDVIQNPLRRVIAERRVLRS